MLPLLVLASTYWYCGLFISLPNLSLISDLLGVISYTRYTHIHWVLSSHYMSIHIQYIFHRRSARLHLISSSAVFFSCLSGSLLIRPSVFISHQLSCISSLHQPSSSAALQAAYSSDLPYSSAISSQLPTLLSYCSVNQHMTSQYIINTVLFIDNQLWYLIACCCLTQEIEIIDNWFNSLCLHSSSVIYCWILRVDTEF